MQCKQQRRRLARIVPGRHMHLVHSRQPVVPDRESIVAGLCDSGVGIGAGAGLLLSLHPALLQPLPEGSILRGDRRRQKDDAEGEQRESEGRASKSVFHRCFSFPRNAQVVATPCVLNKTQPAKQLSCKAISGRSRWENKYKAV